MTDRTDRDEGSWWPAFGCLFAVGLFGIVLWTWPILPRWLGLL